MTDIKCDVCGAENNNPHKRLVSDLSASESREKLCLDGWNDCKEEIVHLTKENREIERQRNEYCSLYIDDKSERESNLADD
jgi:hypothetical protein